MAFLKMSYLNLISILPLIFGAAIATLGEPSIRTIYQFPNSTWIENLAIRNNEQIIANDLGNPYIYLVDPQSQSAPPPLIYTFPSSTGLLGITELHPDIFIILSLGIGLQNSANSSAVWQVDLRAYSANVPDSAAVKKLADLPLVVVPNGVTVLSLEDNTVLFADSGAGLLYRLNICTMDLVVAIDDPLFKPGSGARTGLNGVRVVDGSTLYFTSTGQGIVGTIPIGSDGHATGPAKVLGYVSNADDFDIGPDGSVWVAQNNNTTLTRIRPDGSASVFDRSQGPDVLNGPTVARFGRGRVDQDVLYVGTKGFFVDVKTGQTVTEGGKIVALQTSEL